VSKFYDIGGLWKSRRDAKSRAYGTLDVVKLREMLDAVGDGDAAGRVRVFVLKAEPTRSGRGPHYRLTVVHEGYEAPRRRAEERSQSRGDGGGYGERAREAFEPDDDEVPF
jgi:hypothetical protein